MVTPPAVSRLAAKSWIDSESATARALQQRVRRKRRLSDKHAVRAGSARSVIGVLAITSTDRTDSFDRSCLVNPYAGPTL
jgi:hypothetical protein